MSSLQVGSDEIDFLFVRGMQRHVDPVGLGIIPCHPFAVVVANVQRRGQQASVFKIDEEYLAGGIAEDIATKKVLVTVDNIAAFVANEEFVVIDFV